MSTIPSFAGFPDEGLAFLAELTDNNNREWFEAHKDTYRNSLMTPAQALVAALGQHLQMILPGIQYDTRLNGSGSFMRIYRDIRFSKDKTPYKTHVSMVFWEGKRKKTENPGFYFRVSAGGASMGAGLHMFPKPMLTSYRDAVADEQMGAELVALRTEIESTGESTVGGEHYRRVPRGYDPDHPRADLLRHNGLFVMSPPIGPEQVQAPELVDICFDWCAKIAPLHRWLVNLAQSAGP